MVEGERGATRDGWEETGVGSADQFWFDRKGFGPGVETSFDDPDSVVSWGKVEGVIGDSSELVVDENLPTFGVASGRKEAGTV